jgi:hypothetical protein
VREHRDLIRARDLPRGQAVATLAIPPGSDPGLAGVTLHHANVAAEVLGTIAFTSNAVPALLVP